MGIEKYYTPELEELHFGFVYEILLNGEWKENTLEPCRTAYLQTDLDPKNINDAVDAIKSAVVRVKYLDREDIEECGWVPANEEQKKKYASLLIGGNVFVLIIDGDIRKECLLQHGSGYVLIHVGIEKALRGYGHNMNISFSGTIKNKSELKKLMKQLNIWK